VFIVLGLDFAPTELLGGTLVPFPFLVVISGFSLDASGALAFPATGGSNFTSTLSVQVVLGGGSFEFSNALAVETGVP
jgi:hypothetical protein